MQFFSVCEALAIEDTADVPVSVGFICEGDKESSAKSIHEYFCVIIKQY